MEPEPSSKPPLLRRRTTRRAVLGGSVALSSLAAAYAALGDPLDLLGGDRGGTSAEALDTDAIAKESVRISHLLRRAGFGASREEFDHYQSLGLERSIDELLNFAVVDDSEAIAAASTVPIEYGLYGNLATWWLIRMANTKRPLQEKMTLFWHGVLTTQMSDVLDPPAMQRQNEFLREHAFDAFDAILRGIARDPAMMVYLDISGSVRRAPNENYARELMELFALGEGNFTERDVREAARAFTGWLVPRANVRDAVFALGEPTFRPAQFDDGVKTVLGRSGNFRPDDIADIVVQQPASHAFIVGKLFRFFVHPEPTEADLRPFIDVYATNGRRIGPVVEAMLRSDVFYSPRAYRALVKSPIEYTIGALKALGMQANASQVFGAQGRQVNLTAMGQVPFEPPNVAGWPGGATWLNSSAMFTRLNFINLVTGGAPRGAGTPRPAPLPGTFGTARQAVEHYLPYVLDDNLPAQAREVLYEYCGGADAPLQADQLRGLVYLILASPQFHLA